MSFSYEPLILHRDPRGAVVEPVDFDTLQRQANAHLVVTAPGMIRGNHYHPKGAEVAAILGPALVRVKLDQGLRDIEVPSGEAYRFYFPPGLSHAIKNIGESSMILVAFNTVVHDAQTPDVVRDVLIDPHT